MNVFKKTALFLTLILVENLHSQSSEFDGFVLYNKQNQNIAYLIDKDGNIAHTWNCDLACNYTVLLKNNGNIVENGKKMFIYQALASFKIWHGVQPEINDDTIKLLDQ